MLIYRNRYRRYLSLSFRLCTFDVNLPLVQLVERMIAMYNIFLLKHDGERDSESEECV